MHWHFYPFFLVTLLCLRTFLAHVMMSCLHSCAFLHSVSLIILGTLLTLICSALWFMESPSTDCVYKTKGLILQAFSPCSSWTVLLFQLSVWETESPTCLPSRKSVPQTLNSPVCQFPRCDCFSSWCFLGLQFKYVRLLQSEHKQLLFVSLLYS